jgi:hypothetical protein
MRTRKVDFKSYFSNEAREARRGLVQRRSASRFDGASGEADMAREVDVEHQRREAQVARDERVSRRAMTKFVPAADQLANAQNGDRDAARRLIRHASHSPQAQAEALFALDELKDRAAAEHAAAWRAQNPMAAAQADEKARREAREAEVSAIRRRAQEDGEVTEAAKELRDEPRFFREPPR